MEFMLGFVFGFFAGLLSLYFYDHKQNISYTIATLKEDLTSLHVKIDRFISLQK